MTTFIERRIHPPRQIIPESVAEVHLDEHENEHLAHHFETPVQQFEAAKLGMWLFLATEILLFGGLFCLYAVFRHTRPEIFGYGSRFLDTQWGAINTVVLILSSMTMAWAVRCAQLNQRKRLVTLLALTILGGATFMAVKYVEYRHKFHENLVWGLRFYEQPHSPITAAHQQPHKSPAAALPAPPAAAADATKGKELWMATCRTCHGIEGEGIPGQGKDIRGSEFIASKNDKELVAFIKVGRMPFDKLNTTGIQMPSKGGNPMLTDANLADIVAYIRTFQAPVSEPAVIAANDEAAAPEPSTVSPSESRTAEVSTAPKEEFYMPKSVIPIAARGPAGLIAYWDNPTQRKAAHGTPADPRLDPDRPANAHLFFGIYFLMTGLHGVHVVLGMVLISWLLVRTLLGHFSSEYFTPIDLVGLYWHVVDIIWIFLFPLLYLIH